MAIAASHPIFSARNSRTKKNAALPTKPQQKKSQSHEPQAPRRHPAPSAPLSPKPNASFPASLANHVQKWPKIYPSDACFFAQDSHFMVDFIITTVDG